jgi:hypothetical protein
MLKKIMFATIAASALTLQVTAASAQATAVAASPAQARTHDAVAGALTDVRLNRMVREARGFEPFAAALRPASVADKHTAYISSY